jgi:hypothetical protein
LRDGGIKPDRGAGLFQYAFEGGDVALCVIGYNLATYQNIAAESSKLREVRARALPLLAGCEEKQEASPSSPDNNHWIDFPYSLAILNKIGALGSLSVHSMGKMQIWAVPKSALKRRLFLGNVRAETCRNCMAFGMQIGTYATDC